MGSHRYLAAVAAASFVLLAGCTSATKSASPSTSAPSTSPSATSPPAGSATSPPAGPAKPVWLCRPGVNPDPCASGLDAQVVTSTGSRTLQSASPATASPFDCFYVYPTVSTESGANSDLAVQKAEIAAAKAQADRFSQVCRVWAPMYRQVTTAALFTGGLSALNVAYDSLLSDWRYYLQHDNQGRPIIFIGHSQGAAMLIRLLSEQVDPDAALRRQLVVAILAGGNLQVPTGATVGATFEHIPLCTSTASAGCAIAYSTFGSPPPAGALFGRPGTGVSLMSLQVGTSGQQVACVNPAAIGGGSGPLSPYFPQAGTVPWVTYPGLYRAECKTAGGATWLQVDTLKKPGDTRPVVTDSLGPTWGYHPDDINLALGNLVSDVSAFESAYQRG